MYCLRRKRTKDLLAACEALRRYRRLESRDGLYFDQELLLHQPVDDQEGVGRVGAVGEHPREFAQPVLHEFRDVLRVHEVGGELRHVAPAGAGGLERLLDLGEHARALRVEIVAGGEHSRDEQELAGLDPRDVGILAERLAEAFRVDDPDLGHGAYLRAAERRRAAICFFTAATSSARRTGLAW